MDTSRRGFLAKLVGLSAVAAAPLCIVKASKPKPKLPLIVDEYSDLCARFDPLTYVGELRWINIPHHNLSTKNRS